MYLKQFDVVGLIETWCDVSEAPMMEGFTILGGCNATKSSARKGRKSGGLIIYAKEKLDGVQLKISSHCSNSAAVIINKSVIMFTYRTPEGSPYCDANYFGQMEDWLTEIECSGVHRIVVMGDLNSRTGEDEDFIEWDKSEELDSFEIKKRRNRDEGVNGAGKALLDTCKLKGLRIINGRTSSDPEGDYTFIGPQGQSTIDYVLVSEDRFDEIRDLKVGCRIESHHMPLEIHLQSPQENNSDKQQEEHDQSTKLIKYKWKDEEALTVETQINKQNDWLKDKMENATESKEYAGILRHWMKRVFRSMKVGGSKANANVSESELDVLEKEVKNTLNELKASALSEVCSRIADFQLKLAKL